MNASSASSLQARASFSVPGLIWPSAFQAEGNEKDWLTTATGTPWIDSTTCPCSRLTLSSGGRLNLCIYRCRKPTIVALNGSAVGLGMTLGLSAAIRIAHASSKYGFVFARRGITMESNSSFFLPRLIGHSNALYLLTTGDTYRGDSKHFGSLFQEVIEDQAGVLKRALELAASIAKNTSVLAGFMNRELMWRGKPSAEETHLLDSAVLYHMFANPDCKEGVQSFLEKRPATFAATLEKDGPPMYPWHAEVDVGSRPRVRNSSQSKL
jgi:enoyl-CoA hydratase/carnithine racemase